MGSFFEMSGTRHWIIGCPERSSDEVANRHPEEYRPLSTGTGDWLPSQRTFKIDLVEFGGRPCFLGKRTRVRARAWLETEAPVPPDDDTLKKVQEEAAAIVREAKDDGSLHADAHAIGGLSQSYYTYLLGPRYRRPKPSGYPMITRWKDL